MMHKQVVVFLLIAVLLISGCFRMEIEQKLKRNGLYDLTVKLNADSSLILAAAKEGMKVDPLLQDKATISENEQGITWSFKDLSLKERYNLFQQNGTQSTGDLNLSDSRFEQDFKFPFNYYKYFIGGSAVTAEDVNAPVDSIVDDEGILDDETKAALMGQIGFILQNDSVQTLVMIRRNVSVFQYYDLKPQMTERLGNDYFLVFVSPDTMYCKVDTGIFDEEVQREVDALNAQLNAQCSQGLFIEGVVGAVAGLYDYSANSTIINPLSDEMQQLLAESVNVDYIIDVYGSVVDTNGEKVSSKQVKFSLLKNPKGPYYVEFRDFFLNKYLGDYGMYYAGGAVLIVLILIFVIFRPKKSKNTMEEYQTYAQEHQNEARQPQRVYQQAGYQQSSQPRQLTPAQQVYQQKYQEWVRKYEDYKKRYWQWYYQQRK
jgi:hypothetical protein